MSLNLSVFGYNVSEFKMSESQEYNILYGNIENDVLNIQAKNVLNKDIGIIEINGKQINTRNNNGWFYFSVPLDKVQKGTYSIQIYAGNVDDSQLWTYLSRGFEIEYQKEWVIKEKYFYDNNEKVALSIRNNAVSMLPVTSTVKNLSDTIVEGSKNEYDKLAKLYNWVVNNIKYDREGYYLHENSYFLPDDVIKEGKAVCYGIAITYQALCHAQGISCITYTGVAYDDMGNVESHAWNEVYVNNQWLFVDCTSDTKYELVNGAIKETSNGVVNYEYFLSDLNGISDFIYYEKQHTLFDNLATLNTEYKYSNWAKDELINSMYYTIFEGELKGDLTRPITRGEFCKLLVEYILVQLSNKDTFNLTNSELNEIVNKGLSRVEIPFVSEYNYMTSEIMFCYVNGIVKGKSNNYFGVNDNITREEAATMLARTITYLNGINKNFKYSNDLTIRFADDNNVSNWAKESVSVVNSMGVMNGVGNNRFDPKGLYTIEQTVATLNRMYRFNYYVK